MKRLVTVGVALAAVLALTAFAAAMASAALPEFLPGTANKVTNAGGKAVFVELGGFGSIECSSSEGKGEIATAKTGTFDELYLGCVGTLSGKCTGLNDTVKGSILAKGTFKIGYLNKAEKDVGIGFTIEPIHIECEKTTLIKLVEIKGCAIGLITPVNVSQKTATIKLTAKEAGKNDFTKFENGEECKLLSSLNGAATKQSSQVQTAELTAEKAVELMA